MFFLRKIQARTGVTCRDRERMPVRGPGIARLKNLGNGSLRKRECIARRVMERQANKSLPLEDVTVRLTVQKGYLQWKIRRNYRPVYTACKSFVFLCVNRVLLK
ncbi:hypothetical protein BL250_09465 [Erwinia sp. OLTSP20]|nr:hypothetical protein BV501_07145 [Erwinia sp. OAMSP11]PIJ75420.1 hypothetical protein BK416_01940 [Erwinia sp. OLSSP12]PIJ81918.1 hypothetical protein BLD47_07490 [Erwinia sp. OLCASP19]PIJ84573.1 hypothetical protein BLD46_07580 [Erwinia sp. OLMTSP26]PIJ86920.1 hypothetical protein BLD49_07350 [Erwinia sp. OLMDSP33]PIJ91015.1 hypothetical protein BL249_10460 [Erwinia sp. OLFS4]PIJ92504.1 hypothetical protein BL250_09465 [Erwinia sp. OLTSP20]